MGKENQLPSLKTYNLFISHSWTYSNAYDNFCNLLDHASLFLYNNYSVPKDDPIHNTNNTSQLYAAIKNHVTPCHIVIIMAGVYATYSKWIDKEISIAKKEFSNPKPILAVKPWGNTNVSTLVTTNADEVVSWNTSSIVTAIRKLTL